MPKHWDVPSDFGRVFPHDAKNTPNCIAQGLLYKESFIEGLSPQAFFIHAIAVRSPSQVRAGPAGQDARPSWRGPPALRSLAIP